MHGGGDLAVCHPCGHAYGGGDLLLMKGVHSHIAFHVRICDHLYNLTTSALHTNVPPSTQIHSNEFKCPQAISSSDAEDPVAGKSDHHPTLPRPPWAPLPTRSQGEEPGGMASGSGFGSGSEPMASSSSRVQRTLHKDVLSLIGALAYRGLSKVDVTSVGPPSASSESRQRPILPH